MTDAGMSSREMVVSSMIPGAMDRVLLRELPDGGLIEFEEAPAGWLTKAGEPRKKPWRAYYWTAPDSVSCETRRVRLPSTTTLLDQICPKPGLAPWAEREGIIGTASAIEGGLMDPSDPDPVRTVRRLGMGADAARDEAAERGLNVHALLEEYMKTGLAPTLAGHPSSHHGYIQALTAWLLEDDPEPVAVEQLVVHPEDGWAGRLDLRARIKSVLTTIDLTTSVNAAIFRGKHLQVSLYERGARRCGDEPADRKKVVVCAADGLFRKMDADWADGLLDAALAFHRLVRPVDSACEQANRRERKARQPA